MELRVLFPIAFKGTWYGRWGYNGECFAKSPSEALSPVLEAAPFCYGVQRSPSFMGTCLLTSQYPIIVSCW